MRMAGEAITQWGYMDRMGKVVIDFQFDQAGQFSEGLACVEIGGQHGFIDHSGNLVIAPQFGEESQTFFEGLAVVQTGSGKCGFIDKRGRFEIPAVFDWAKPFSEGIALVRVDGKYGYIHRGGKYLVEPRFDHAGDFRHGYASVSINGKWHYIDRAGDLAYGPFGAAGRFSDGVARISLNGSDALLRLDGSIVRAQGVDWLSAYFSEERIEFSHSELYGYLDRECEIVIPGIYEATTTFREGLASVLVDGKWGYIDPRGTMVIEPQFDRAGFFQEGLALIQNAEGDAYIDRSGAVVIQAPFQTGFPFREGVTPVYRTTVGATGKET